MSSRNRILLAIGSLLLILVFAFPIWMISLKAPQYPEGLGLRIWVNQITGENKHDLRLINQLNHYIGMKEIHPESIAELTIMPFVVGFLIFLGMLTSLLGKRKLLAAWLILIVALGVIGLADFYKWGYDYGHDLDPNAPIKVPGMTYQPPLIGSKQLLNINALSLPHVGFLIIVASFGLGVTAYFSDKPRNQNRLATSHEKKAIQLV